MNIKERLEEFAEGWRKLNAPCSNYEFVLEFGTVRQGSSYDGQRMTPKECFSNAGRLCLESSDLLYVEGFAMGNDISLPFEHAWCEDENGKVLDPTLREPENYEFYGVAYTPDQLRSRILETEFWGMYFGSPIWDLEAIEEEAAKRRGG